MTEQLPQASEEIPVPDLRRTDHFSLSVLQLIRSGKLITRADIAEKTARSGFLTSKVCDELIEAGFISEVGVGDSTGGRRPALLSLKPGLGRLIGVHLGTINLRIAITDFAGNLIRYQKTASHAAKGPDFALKTVTKTLDKMLDETGVSASQISGLGLGVSSVLSPDGVILHWPRLSTWTEVPIKRLLEEHYKTVVMVDDTPRTTALAEVHKGSLYQFKTLIYVTLGVGTGAAIFINGNLYRGSGGFAGELGHVSVAELGPVCSCGNRGCLETLISASELIHRAQEGLSRGLSPQLEQLADGSPANLTVEMLGTACRMGDRFAQRILEDASAHLGRALVSLVNLLNPDLIVIGGGIASAAGDFVIPWVTRVVKQTAMASSARQLEIRLSTLDETGPAVGATLLVAEEALKRAFLGQSPRGERGNKVQGSGYAVNETPASA